MPETLTFVPELEKTLIDYGTISYLSITEDLRRRGLAAWPTLGLLEMDLATNLDLLFSDRDDARIAASPPININVSRVIAGGLRLAKRIDQIACLRPSPLSLVPKSVSDQKTMVAYARSLNEELPNYAVKRPESAWLAVEIPNIRSYPFKEMTQPNIDWQKADLRAGLWADGLKLGFMALEAVQADQDQAL